MKIIEFLVIISAFIIAASAKATRKTIKLANFYKEGPFIFVTKLHIGAGFGQTDVTYTKGDQIESQALYNDLSIGIINQTVFSRFSAEPTCQQKIKFFYKIDKLNLRQEKQGSRHVKIPDLRQEELWYFYIFACTDKLEQLANSSEEITFSFSVLNNGSHYGQNQQTLYAYVAILIIWTLLIIKFAFPMGSLLSLDNPSGIKLTIFGGLVILGAAYLYRLIHLMLYNLDGVGIHIFQILYLILKNIGEAIITTVIVSVSWGWSIVHLNHNQSYIIIGVLTGIVNIVSLILSSLTEEHEQIFHHYDTIPGGIVLILRIIIFLVFMVGIATSLKESAGKIVYFIRKLAVIGGLYLISWPATVLVVQLTLPNYMHREVITFVQEAVHICACTLICQMISNPQSAYRKVSLHEDDNPLRMGDYRKK